MLRSFHLRFSFSLEFFELFGLILSNLRFYVVGNPFIAVALAELVVVVFVLFTHVLHALVAVESFTATLLYMFDVVGEVVHLITVQTFLWLKFTGFFMVPELVFYCTEATMFALYFDVGFSFVVFLIFFGHYLPAVLTLVIHAGATDFVHADFSSFNVPFAGAAFFRFHFCPFDHLINYYVC